jgi:hypothetical protein
MGKNRMNLSTGPNRADNTKGSNLAGLAIWVGDHSFIKENPAGRVSSKATPHEITTLWYVVGTLHDWRG